MKTTEYQPSNYQRHPERGVIFRLTAEERRGPAANEMTAVGLTLLLECYYMGTDLSIGNTASRRMAANFLLRAGLIKFRDPQVPENGLQVTERGRRHVERILALPVLQTPQEGPQNEPGGVAPRFIWGYDEEAQAPRPQAPLSAGDALNRMVSANGTYSNPVATSIFLEALTWDQQARVLERLGWRRAP